MNQSPQYNHHSDPEVEEVCIYQNVDIDRHSI